MTKNKDAQATLITTLMEFMEPFTTRANLLVRQCTRLSSCAVPRASEVRLLFGVIMS